MSQDGSSPGWRRTLLSNHLGRCGMATMDDLSRAKWRKSTYSGNGGSCVEVARWRTSSHSNNGGECVEVAADRRAIAVRDSKDPDGPKLVFPSASWLAFTGKLKARH